MTHPQMWTQASETPPDAQARSGKHVTATPPRSQRQSKTRVTVREPDENRDSPEQPTEMSVEQVPGAQAVAVGVDEVDKESHVETQ